MAENWRIAWAYYAFMADAPVQVAKFMNEAPIYSKDKEGSNCAILTAQLLNYLKEGKRGFVIDRMDGLNRYKRRYLSGDPRTAAFVGLLFCLVKAHFRRDKPKSCRGLSWKGCRRSALSPISSWCAMSCCGKGCWSWWIERGCYAGMRMGC